MKHDQADWTTHLLSKSQTPFCILAALHSSRSTCQDHIDGFIIFVCWPPDILRRISAEICRVHRCSIAIHILVKQEPKLAKRIKAKAHCDGVSVHSAASTCNRP